MATVDPTAAADILRALRDANDGWAITVWTDKDGGGWKLWRTLDAKYAEKEPGWVMTIPVHDVADQFAKETNNA